MSKVYNKPDLFAPRFYSKRKNIVDDQFIKEFKEKYPAFKKITKAEFNNIVKAFSSNVWKEVIEHRDGVKLPESTGTIFIGTCAPPKKSRNIDHKLLMEKNIAASNKNWETDGHLAKIFFSSYWEKYNYRFKDFWIFKAHRTFKRTVSKEYPKNWTMYHKIDPSRQLGDQLNLRIMIKKNVM
jgi:hypothetical protein